MKRPIKKIILAVLIANSFLTFSQSDISISQTDSLKLTKKDSVIVSYWVAGIGFNMIDDSAKQFEKLFDFEGEWNAVPYPSRLNFGKYFKNGLGIEAIAAYNKYKKGKIVDAVPLAEDKDYFSIDSRLSYDLNKIIGETGWFDPYVGVGVGFTHANDISRGTYNGVIGFRTWFSDRVGLDFNSSGKWTMNSNFNNHLQHAVGLVYRFGIEKELTEEGEAKLALIEKLEQQKDSIAAANLAKEKEAELLKKLAEQKEKERLAQLEKEKQEARENKRKEIENEINNVSKVYFAFDSSILNSNSKNALDQFTKILNNYPELTVEIGSHTDSRGSNAYNFALSERRLKSTLDYLLQQGVSADKVSGKAYGEEKLLNECDDNTKCTESKHRENRRSEINIINY